MPHYFGDCHPKFSPVQNLFHPLPATKSPNWHCPNCFLMSRKPYKIYYSHMFNESCALLTIRPSLKGPELRRDTLGWNVCMYFRNLWNKLLPRLRQCQTGRGRHKSSSSDRKKFNNRIIYLPKKRKKIKHQDWVKLLEVAFSKFPIIKCHRVGLMRPLSCSYLTTGMLLSLKEKSSGHHAAPVNQPFPYEMTIHYDHLYKLCQQAANYGCNQA